MKDLTFREGPRGCTLVGDTVATAFGFRTRGIVAQEPDGSWGAYFDGNHEGPTFPTREDAIAAVGDHVAMFPEPLES